METKLKQRLVGVLVLCALAVIFIPLLFHNSSPVPKQIKLLTSIPPAPAKPAAQTVITLQDDDNATTLALPQENTPTRIKTDATTVKQATPAVATAEQTQLAAPHETLSQDTTQHGVLIVNSTMPRQAVTAQPSQGENVASLPAAESQSVSTVEAEHARRTKVAAETKQMLAQEINSTITAQSAVVNKTQTAAKTTPDRTTVTAGWVLQVGSFTNTKNAVDLEKQLRDKGFTVYTREIKLDQAKSAIKLFIGPEVKRSQIEAVQTKLEQEMHIKGIVQNFDPLQVKQPKPPTN